MDIDLATLRRLAGAEDLEDTWVERQAAALTRARLCATTTRELLADQPVRQLPPDLADLDQTGTAVADGGAVQPVLSGLGEGAALAGVGPIGSTLAAALACDSTITPAVTGAVDRDTLAAMTDEWLRAHGMCGRAPRMTPDGDGCGCDLKHGLTTETHLRLQRTMLRWAINVLSGPGGLTSYLRTGILERPLTTPSIVLDVGADTRTVPAPLERVIRRRDTRCRFPGCDHPADLSQVHHLTPRSQGGPTDLWNLLCVCAFHHLIAVHTWGWDLRLNPDGTTTATGPDGRVLHETDPPATRQPAPHNHIRLITGEPHHAYMRPSLALAGASAAGRRRARWCRSPNRSRRSRRGPGGPRRLSGEGVFQARNETDLALPDRLLQGPQRVAMVVLADW